MRIKEKLTLDNFINLSLNDLVKLNEIYGWSLNDKELLIIQKYFKKLKRNPTRCEIETIAQTWSEHCKHKTFNGPVKLEILKDGKKQIKRFKNLFKETIVYATNKLNKKYCLSVFKDNAGVVAFNNRYALCFKTETHNHPCAIEPYGGAETGVGGVIRDILGVGLGAKPILNTDNFCFAYTDKKYDIGKSFLTPHKIVNGVISGVRDYGNKMGIPTAAGSVTFDDLYLYNPLVYVGCVGIIPKNKITKKVKPGQLIVVLGGKTGRDGIGGATFSSADITEETSSSHVQIGDAINEKKVLDVLMKARERNLYTAVTDCGAGGFSSAVGEMASEVGAKVYLDRVVLKDKNIEGWEIWLSESQERMVLAVDKNKFEELKRICEIEDCLYYVIGEFTGDKKLKVFYKNETIADLDMEFLHERLPKIEKKAKWIYPKMINKISKVSDLEERFKKIISDLNVSSKRWIVEQYDHEVMAQTALKPFFGPKSSVPTDACVIWPNTVLNDKSFKGFAVSHGIKPVLSLISPYDMSFYAVDEAIRNLVCVGADIKTVSILDNFCSANPNDPKIMGEFTMAALGARDAAILMEAPFISGKDSFYNQTRIGNKVYSIPTTLLISAIAIVKDIRKIITPNFKKEGSVIYVCGRFLKGLGGSIYHKIFEKENNFISQLDLKENRKLYLKLLKLMWDGKILSAHDVSDGGFIAAIAEMCFGGVGVEIDIDNIINKYEVSEIEALFGECGSKIIIEVDEKDKEKVEKTLKDFDFVKIGYCGGNKITVKNLSRKIIDLDINECKRIWERV